MRYRGQGRWLRLLSSARPVHALAVLALTFGVASTGVVALAVPAHAVALAPTLEAPLPPLIGNDRSPTVSFSGPGTTYECSFKAASATPAYVACTSPWTPAAVTADGDYTLAVREVTVTGDADPALRSYTLDTVAQVTVSSPASPGRDRTPAWAVSVEPGGSATCTFDGLGVGDCTTGFSAPALLTDGPHVLDVAATDALGNSGQASSTYVLDTVAPGTPVLTGSAGTAQTPSVSWSWANPDGDTASCTLSGPDGPGTAVPCTTPASFAQALTRDGTYLLSLVLTDAAGNVSAPVATSPAYTLDTVPPPAPTFTSSPTSPSTDPTPTWTFTATGSTTTCQLVGTTHGVQPPFPCPGGTATATLAGDDGWTLTVTTADAYGNSSSADSAQYVLDTTGPNAPVVTGPTGLGNNASPHVIWTGESPTTARCRLVPLSAGSPDAWSDCTAGVFDPVLGSDGDYRVEVQLTDSLGNVGDIGTSGVYTYDGTAPARPVVTGPAATSNDPTPTFTFSVEAGGTARCQVYVRGSAPTTPAYIDCTPGSFTPTLTADGPYTVEVITTDAAGNDSPTGKQDYLLDTSGPAPVVIVSPPSPSSDRAPFWGLTGDGSSTLTCRLQQGTTTITSSTGCDSGFQANLTGRPDATYTLEVTATDAAQNKTIMTATYVLDTTAPTAPVITGPASPGNAFSVTWTFPVQSQTVAQCRLAQGLSTGPWSDCSTGLYTTSGLPDGTYTVEVLVTDLAGNAAALASSAGYTTDRTAPVAPVVTGPSGLGNNPTPTWTLTGEAGVTASCRLDRAGALGSAVPCTGGTFKPTLSGDTTYVVVVQLLDAAGNVSAPTATAPYTLDTVAPLTPAVSGPSGTGNASTVSWTWPSEAGATSTCQLVRAGVAGALSGCTSGQPVTLPGDATYSLQVTVTDAAGNASPTGSSGAYLRDATAPAAPVVLSPTSPSSTPMPSFTFTAEAGSATACRVTHDGALVQDWASGCTSPHVVDLTGAPEGSYLLAVRSTDVAGNTGPVGSSLPYVLDTVAPDAPVVTLASGPSQNSSPTVTWTGEAGTVATCRLVLNGVARPTTTSCSSPWQPTLDVDGRWSVRVRLFDAAGNRSLLGISGGYVLDTTPPVVPVVTAPASPGRNPLPSWSAVVESGTTTECRLTSGAGSVLTDWTRCVLPYTTDLTGGSDGSYSLAVRATDAVGLVSPTGSASYLLDRTAPSAPVFVNPPASPARGRVLMLTFTAEAGATLTCRLTSGATVVSPDTACISPLAVNLIGLPDGSYTLSARATDAAGNTGAAQTVVYVLDTTAPAAPVLTTGPAATGPDRTPSWAFTVAADATVTCRLSGSTVGTVKTDTSCTSPFSGDLSARPDDTYTLTAVATDAAGNTSTTLSTTYVLDATAPTTAHVIGPVSPGGNTNPTWLVTSTEGTIECRLVKGASTLVRDWAGCGPTFSMQLTGDGTYTLSARVVDAAGNVSAEVASRYVLDTTPPPPASLTIPASPSTDRAPTWTVASADPGVTAACEVLGPTGAVFQAFAPCSVSAAGSPFDLDLRIAPDGPWTLVVRLTDAAGNTGPDASGSYVLDTTAPSAVLISTAPAWPAASPTPAWQVVGDSDSVLECRLTGPSLTGQGFAPCTPTPGVPGVGSFAADLTNRPDGTYSLSVRSRDAAGNVGPETTGSYLLDRVPPSTPEPPVTAVALSQQPVVTWVFTVDQGATALCTLGSDTQVVQPEQVCTSPWTTDLTSAPDGSYTLSLRAVDDAGNSSGSVGTRYDLDRTAPLPPSIIHNPGTPGPEPQPYWVVQPSEPGGHLECELIGTDRTPVWASCTDRVTYDLGTATAGTYQLQVREYDDADNVSPVVTSENYVFDLTAPPTPRVVSPEISPSNNSAPVFHIERKAGDTDTRTLRCTVTRKDGLSATASPCDFGANRVELLGVAPDSEFDVILTVTGVDGLGNVSGKESAVYKFDNRPPPAPLIRALDVTTGLSPKRAWSFAGSDDTVAFTCTLSRRGSAPRPMNDCASPQDLTLATPGEWTLSVTARDASGNVSPAATSTYTYLPPVPVVTSVRAPVAGADSTPTWTFIVPRGYTASCLVSNAGGTTVARADCTRGSFTPSLVGLAEGTYTLSAQLTDAFANNGRYGVRSAYRYVPKKDLEGHLGQPGPTTTGPGPVVLPPAGARPPSTLPPPNSPGSPTIILAGPVVLPPFDRGTHPTVVALAGPPTSPTKTGGSKPTAIGTVLVPGGFLPLRVPNAIAATVVAAVGKPTLPLLLLVVVVGFLLLQNRIDRRDPKLASAPVGAEPELDFGPVRGRPGDPRGGGRPA